MRFLGTQPTATDSAATATSDHPLAALRPVLDAALDCVIVIDEDGCVVEFNAAAEHTFGYTREEALGREMGELIVPPALRARHRAGLQRFIDGGPARVMGQRVELTAMRADETEFPVELTITRVEIDEQALFVGYLRDITVRKTREEELRRSRARIVAAADEARRRLERDLHDGAQQHLVGLALTLRLAKDQLATDPEAARELIAEAAADLDAATADLRALARGIHPAVLTGGGLRPALRSLAGRSPLPIEVDVESLPAGRLDPLVEATAYFVLAEGLTNIAKYSEAARAWVRIAADGDDLLVEVGDDGRGGADRADGSGLLGLTDRVAATGGTLTVTSPAGGGTTLLARLQHAAAVAGIAG